MSLEMTTDGGAQSAESQSGLTSVLEPEVMDGPEEAQEYDAMDHAQVNARFVDDLLAVLGPRVTTPLTVLDVGTGTAQIPIALCQRERLLRVVGVDLAASMLERGRQNVARANLAARISLQCLDAKQLEGVWEGGYLAVISNSIVHHIARPASVLEQLVRVVAPGGVLFVRDLLRPVDERHLTHIVDSYAAKASARARGLFAASLRAALTVAEMRQLVSALGFSPSTVSQTSDRHFTWVVTL